MAVIRLPEIEEIFTVLDRRGISREAVVIPLTKRDPSPGALSTLSVPPMSTARREEIESPMPAPSARRSRPWT